ncbi:CWC16 protein [Echria macrotheca]|uniref:Splicing factor YJU2 n=1 Tax=Echria macrotheca TaxID=438768 RepID=A0AAJ0FGH0_9PEZI|nr:CWC16 protein [Echria macrotheca]
MSERKVLTKYYPPDFDPSLVGRSRGPKQAGPKVQTVRLMAPFSFRCTACGEYMYKGRKFNARKETPPDEKYLSIQVFRFYIRCTRCSNEIVFRTDPKNQDYVMERGAKRNTEPWRRGLEGTIEESDEARLDRLEREMAEADGETVEERNAMAELEAKTADAKREMAVADALDEIRSRNARIEKAHREGVDVVDVVVVPKVNDEEEEDAEAARRAFAFAKQQEAWEEPVVEDEGPPVEAAGPSPAFKRQVKKKKDHSALLGIKKKQPLV